jgi:hypothetical protein
MMILLAGSETPDCFMQLGAYTVCSETLLLSVFVQLFFIMAQALIIRIFFPGVSCFLNASVRRFLAGCLHSVGSLFHNSSNLNNCNVSRDLNFILQILELSSASIASTAGCGHGAFTPIIRNNELSG